jgi:chromate transporter
VKSVRRTTVERRPFPLVEFIRASSLHVGAAAAAAALRRDLVDSGRLPSGAFDEAYAVARVTPGTNLLAMYVLLGERFAGWRGAITALGVGAFVPALIVVLLGAAYVTYSDHLIVREVMQGARAGALAVFAWAIVRLVRPQIQQHRRRGVAIAFGTLLIALALPIPQFMILLIAGAVGAALLKVDA